jgi:hypothetical protein
MTANPRLVAIRVAVSRQLPCRRRRAVVVTVSPEVMRQRYPPNVSIFIEVTTR